MGANLKSILCQNKSKLLPNSYPGVNALSYSYNVDYIGETKKKVMTRTVEHQQDRIKRKWESSGAMEHCLKCNGVKISRKQKVDVLISCCFNFNFTIALH